MAARAGQTIPREELSQVLWGGEYGDDFQPLRVAIARVRDVLKDQAKSIVNMRNVGYQLIIREFLLKQKLTEDF